IADRYVEQEMRCPTHLCIGQEAIAVGVCDVLERKDKVFSNHRAHGHYLAKGGDLSAMIAELYGRVTGCCGGRGGSMHLIDLDAGVMGTTPIVGGTIPVATGSAWASALQKRGEVTVVFFGEGCFEEGVMHESLNFAALHKLPIVFICENNEFSVYTPLSLRQPQRPIHTLAAAHGLTAAAGDGNDVDAVRALAKQAISAARAGQGPQFLELSTFRWREHCGPNFDHELNYRPAADIEAGMADCPIERYKTSMTVQGKDVVSLVAKLESQLRREIDAAFAFSDQSANPLPSAAREKLYA
ncbi:MAG: thiamine pyrophosphate-dependent dehydrogenase E1 component subunit alpha, partial [Proteobacteria bacterium]|nr:thiamine pyrophosphate-dependent dehydrogenase E1 component subunit alpha [Pseudomonadota bacterium]